MSASCKECGQVRRFTLPWWIGNALATVLNFFVIGLVYRYLPHFHALVCK